MPSFMVLSCSRLSYLFILKMASLDLFFLIYGYIEGNAMKQLYKMIGHNVESFYAVWF